MTPTTPSPAAAKADRKDSERPEEGPARQRLTVEDHLAILWQLYLARYFDVRLIKEKKHGRLSGTLYSSHNQEGILVGSLYALEPQDWISPVHRDMPAFFLKDAKSGLNNPNRMGMSIEEVCCQVWGRECAPGRARDNWSHIGSKEKHIIHSTSMLAGTIPVAAGVVLADRLDGGNAVVLTYNGEGSTAQGVFHEAVNFAAIYNLPVITIVENNLWAYGTPVELEVPTPDVADRAKGYGIPGLIADGQDVFDVYDKVSWAVKYARAGNGPSIVECKTFRSYGHGDHDDDRAMKYRTLEEIERGRARDPIAICKKVLIEKGILTPEEARKYPVENKSSSEIRDEHFPLDVVDFMKRGVEFALASPPPPAEEAGKWVFREEGE